jgi:leucyl aminopeptidase
VTLVAEGEAPDGAGARSFAAAGMSGKAGEELLVAGSESDLLLVGIGPREGMTSDTVRRALGRVAPRIRGYATVGIPLPSGVSADIVIAAVEGVQLGAYRFDRFRTQVSTRPLGSISIAAERTDGADSAVAFGRASADAGIEARDFANTPANYCTPEDLATHAGSIAELDGIEVNVWREADLERERCGGIIGVGRGSANPPRLVLVSYRGSADHAPIGLVGKGITFDAGGTSVKHAEHLEWMKIDMSGGAAALAAIRAIARLALPVNVIAAVPCAENLTGPTAIKPGDVLRLRSGRTCEIVNTDYEGRVVLADAIDVLRERGAQSIVISATLWGGNDALGDELSPVLGNDDALVGDVLEAAAASGEPAWRLPLHEAYRRELRSTVADLRNKPPDKAAMITAALFLGEFAGNTPWAYLDIGDTAWAASDWDLGPAGATGVPARTILRFALERASADARVAADASIARTIL